MARKKVSIAARKQEEEVKPHKTPRDLSPDNKMDNLKSLNQLLLKETMENRFQIEQLKSQIQEFSMDQPILSHLERDICRLVLSSGLIDEKVRMESGLKAVMVEKAAAEEKARGLKERVGLMMETLMSTEERLRLVVGEKVEIKKALDCVVSERDLSRRELDLKGKEVVDMEKKMGMILETLTNTEERLRLVVKEKDEIKKDLDCVVSERDLSWKEVDLKRKEVGDLEVKVRELELAYFEIREKLHRVVIERDELERRAKRSEEVIEYLEQSMDNMEREREEMSKRHQEEVGLMRVEKEKNDAKVSSLEEECRCLVEVRHRLEAEVRASKDAFDLLKKEEEGLRSEFVGLEKRNAEALEEIERLRVSIGELEKEKKEKEKSFELKIRESTLKIDDLRGRMEEISSEKDEIEQVREKREIEILELQKDVIELNSTVSKLQELCRDHSEKNTQMQADRDAAQRELDLQREEVSSLRLQVEELKKSKDGTYEELGRVKAALDTLVSEKEEGTRHIGSLTEEKALLEKSLLVAQGKFEDMEKKMKAAEMISGKALSLLKGTAEAMNGLEKAQENGVIADEELRPFADGLESIKMAFKSRVGKIEEMNRELQVLQLAVDDAKKKGPPLWMWLYPATTTVFAAISFAYAARGH